MKRTALVFAIGIFCVTATESLFAEHWQRPPMPTIEVLKGATFGPMPTSEQIQFVVALFASQSSRLASLLDIQSSPLQIQGHPLKTYLYTGDSGSTPNYQFGWEVSLRYTDISNTWGTGFTHHVHIFFQDGIPKYRSRKFSTGLTDDNCLIPMTDEDSPEPTCARIGWEVVMQNEFIYRNIRIQPGMTANDVKKVAKSAHIPIGYYHGYYYASYSCAESIVLGYEYNPDNPNSGELFTFQDGKIYGRRLHQSEFSDK
jgi:hypothetical protein